jgi:hypothetical protein
VFLVRERVHGTAVPHRWRRGNGTSMPQDSGQPAVPVRSEGTMKTLISEFAMWLMVIVLVVAGAFFVKDSIAATVGDVMAGWEERKLNRQIVSKLRILPVQRLRSLALDVLLEDVVRLRTWLQTKSILPENQKQKQIEDCNQTLLSQRAHYTAMLGPMNDTDVVKLLGKQISDRNIEWRRNLLNRLKG